MKRSAENAFLSHNLQTIQLTIIIFQQPQIIPRFDLTVSSVHGGDEGLSTLTYVNTGIRSGNALAGDTAMDIINGVKKIEYSLDERDGQFGHAGDAATGDNSTIHLAKQAILTEGMEGMNAALAMYTSTMAREGYLLNQHAALAEAGYTDADLSTTDNHLLEWGATVEQVGVLRDLADNLGITTEGNDSYEFLQAALEYSAATGDAGIFDWSGGREEVIDNESIWGWVFKNEIWDESKSAGELATDLYHTFIQGDEIDIAGADPNDPNSQALFTLDSKMWNYMKDNVKTMDSKDMINAMLDFENWRDIQTGDKESLQTKLLDTMDKVPEGSLLYSHLEKIYNEKNEEELTKMYEYGLISDYQLLKSAHGDMINDKASEWGISPSMIGAIFGGESLGNVYDEEGRIIIRTEMHQFDKYSDEIESGVDVKYGTSDGQSNWINHYYNPNSKSDEDDVWISLDGRGQDLNYQVLEWQVGIDEYAAYMSMSMGMGQIMGFNYATLGYDSAENMFNDFQDNGATAQISGTFNFIENDKGGKLLKSLQNYSVSGDVDDLYYFSYGYNGPGKTDEYSQNLIDEAYKYENTEDIPYLW